VRIVALGDSVTSGYNCHCAAFPAEYAALLANRDSIHAQATNLGVNGLTSAGLLAQLSGGSAADARTQAVVAAAAIVVVTIGANDFSDEHHPITAGTCAGAKHTACTRDELTTMSQTVSRIVDQIRTLRDGTPTTIMLTGYWNVFEDGDVADKAFPDDGVAASIALTKEANAAIRADALAENAIYVDLWPVFEGANSDKDPTGLLASDGNHPNAAGHAAIAAQLLADTPRF
jgi:lysophospholipase L1-like esterase